MLKINLCTTSRQLSPPTLAGLAEYRKRLTRCCPFHWQTGCPVRSVSERSDPGSQTARIRLDRRGQSISSPQLAEQLQRWMSAGYSTVVVELGQPSDLQDPDDDTAESGSELVLSLSPLALSADLVALLAAEQIYRAFRILGNQPYHK